MWLFTCEVNGLESLSNQAIPKQKILAMSFDLLNNRNKDNFNIASILKSMPEEISVSRPTLDTITNKIVEGAFDEFLKEFVEAKEFGNLNAIVIDTVKEVKKRGRKKKEG